MYSWVLKFTPAEVAERRARNEANRAQQEAEEEEESRDLAEGRRVEEQVKKLRVRKMAAERKRKQRTREAAKIAAAEAAAAAAEAVALPIVIETSDVESISSGSSDGELEAITAVSEVIHACSPVPAFQGLFVQLRSASRPKKRVAE